MLISFHLKKEMAYAGKNYNVNGGHFLPSNIWFLPPHMKSSHATSLRHCRTRCDLSAITRAVTILLHSGSWVGSSGLCWLNGSIVWSLKRNGKNWAMATYTLTSACFPQFPDNHRSRNTSKSELQDCRPLNAYVHLPDLIIVTETLESSNS